MELKLMFITNKQDIAKIAESSGVDWIFIDLEINGKEKRQGHLDTVISRHSIDDVEKMKRVLTKSKLLVRVNPIYAGSKKEIDRVINDGTDIVMLPFFKTYDEVKVFVDLVNGRAKTCLLLETPEAVEVIDSILTIEGIDYIHIGLNDLHLGYNKKFMFELLVDGTVEMLCKKIGGRGVTYGFGGIAKLGQGTLPSENIIAEHYRLGSSMVILSRSFCDLSKNNDIDIITERFNTGIRQLRNFESELRIKPTIYYETNKRIIKQITTEIVRTIDKKMLISN